MKPETKTTKPTKREQELARAIRKIYRICQSDDFGMEEQCAINNICVDTGAYK